MSYGTFVLQALQGFGRDQVDNQGSAGFDRDSSVCYG